MVFSDLFFLFVFIPAFVVCYLIAGGIDRLCRRKASGGDGEVYYDDVCKHRRSSHLAKNVVLIAFSLIFYAWGEPVYVFLMLASVLLNYCVGRGIGHCDGKGRRLWLVLGVVANLSVLGTFKYLNFFSQILRDMGLDVADPHIALPIGISFYIFQSISYLVDVYRRESPVQKSFFGLLLYISMFPQLIAGPIVRYNTVADEIDNRRVSAADIADGVFRFMIGLGKKVILANQLGEVATQLIGGDMQQTTVAGAWIGIGAFMLQIYFDFSGYSDMAIGIGRCLGFHFCENFDHPYCSRTITEFWRRWHISLGSFFRDYVYIPLGGNRRHQLVNIMVVWMLTGMWHGASWNFILWGLYFGVILLIEKHTILRIQKHIPSPLLIVYSLAVVLVGWGIFYFDDFGRLSYFFTLAFGGSSAEVYTFADGVVLLDRFWLLVAAVLLCMPVRQMLSRLSDKLLGERTAAGQTVALVARMATSCVILLVSVALLVGATNNAFLYTRF